MMKSCCLFYLIGSTSMSCTYDPQFTLFVMGTSGFSDLLSLHGMCNLQKEGCTRDLFYVLWILVYLEAVQIKEKWSFFSFNHAPDLGLADHWVEASLGIREQGFRVNAKRIVWHTLSVATDSGPWMSSNLLSQADSGKHRCSTGSSAYYMSLLEDRNAY